MWQVYIDRSCEAVDWFIDEIVADSCGEWRPASTVDRFANGINWRATVITCEGKVPKAVEAALQYCTDKGVDVRFETPAVQLATDGDGSVTGAIAKDKDGNYLKVNASKGTLLVTGSYVHNPEMMAERIRPRDMLCYSWVDARMGNTGDGHLMGRAIGAIEDDFRKTPGELVKLDTPPFYAFEEARPIYRRSTACASMRALKCWARTCSPSRGCTPRATCPARCSTTHTRTTWPA